MFNEKNFFSKKNNSVENNNEEKRKNAKEEITKGIKSISKQDIENYEPEFKGEDPQNLLERIPNKLKNLARKAVDRIPDQAKKEIHQSIAYNIKLLKEAAKGLKEKIDWKSLDKKAIAALVIFAFGSITGGVLEAGEAGEEDDAEEFDGEDDIDQDFVEHTIYNAVGDLEQIDGLSQEGGSDFIQAAVELGAKMSNEGLTRQDYNFAINAMIELTKHAAQRDASLDQYNESLDDLVQDFTQSKEAVESSEASNMDNDIDNEVESEKGEEFGSESTGMTLPEKFDLEFDSSFSEFEQAEIQNYYDYTVDTIHELAEQMSDWGEKYGHKANWGQFEAKTKNYIQDQINHVNHIAESAEKGSNMRNWLDEIGDLSPKEKADQILSHFSGITRLRTKIESAKDAFDQL